MGNPKVKTFPELIRWIADHHHDKAVLPIAGKIGVSPALVNLWVKGDTKEPRASNLQRLADAYDLDFIWVLGLVHGKKLAPIAGGSAAVLLPPADRPSDELSATPSPSWSTSKKVNRFETLWKAASLLASSKVQSLHFLKPAGGLVPLGLAA